MDIDIRIFLWIIMGLLIIIAILISLIIAVIKKYVNSIDWSLVYPEMASGKSKRGIFSVFYQYPFKRALFLLFQR